MTSARTKPRSTASPATTAERSAAHSAKTRRREPAARREPARNTRTVARATTIAAIPAPSAAGPASGPTATHVVSTKTVHLLNPIPLRAYWPQRWRGSRFTREANRKTPLEVGNPADSHISRLIDREVKTENRACQDAPRRARTLAATGACPHGRPPEPSDRPADRDLPRRRRLRRGPQTTGRGSQ